MVFLDNKLLNQEYSNQLVSLGLADTLIASFKKNEKFNWNHARKIASKI